MLISVGILARNEAASIESMVTALLQQSALQAGAGCDLPETEWEIVVVANGCSDDTADLARRKLGELLSVGERPNVTWQVREVVEAGKSNAWNLFVHEFSSRTAELFVLIDADIEFGERETISNTVKALLSDPHAAVAVDLPLKDVTRKARKSLIERLSAATSRANITGSAAISGQFYCARASALRAIWMPKGLPVEDGYLRAMVVTDCFRKAVDNGKVIRAPNAKHYYKTLVSFRSIFRHELRIVIGTATNCYLTWDFLLFATDPHGAGAGALVRDKLAEDPQWYSRLIANAVRNHGSWVLPRNMLFRRLHSIRNAGIGLGLPKAVVVGLAGFLIDVPILIAANSKLKRGAAIGYW